MSFLVNFRVISVEISTDKDFFGNFYCTKRFVFEFQGESLELFLSYRAHFCRYQHFSTVTVKFGYTHIIFWSKWFILCEKIRKIANGKNVKSMTIPVLTKSSPKMKSEKFLSNAM